MYIFFPLTSLTVHDFSTIMSISMPAEGAEPTEKCKKSCKAGEILTSAKHFPMLVTLICILLFFFLKLYRKGLLTRRGSLLFTHAGASTKNLLKMSNKRHTCDALGAFPGQRVSAVMSRTPASRTFNSSHTVRRTRGGKHKRAK